MAKKIDGVIERPREAAAERKAARKTDAQRRKAAREAKRTEAAEVAAATSLGIGGAIRWTLLAAGGIAALGAALIAALFVEPKLLAPLNSYKSAGEIQAPWLKAPLTIRRDASGVPYVFADSYRDALYGQGFALAQDRLLQMEGMRRYAAGRLSEVFGGAFLPADRMARTIGFRRMARDRLRSLDGPSRAELAAFAAGLNGFIRARPMDAPLELKVLGLGKLEAWTPVDILSIVYLQSWLFTSPMIEAELTAQAILERFDGDEPRAEAFFPFVVNPDEPGSGEARDAARAASGRPYIDLDLDLTAPIWGAAYGESRAEAKAEPLQGGYAGSNNWAFTGDRIGRKAAIVANDPHLDIRRLPGPWHPVGLFTRDGLRAVGANVGLPGLFVGRSGGVGFGVTVGYADTADLVIETIDPNRPGWFVDNGRWVEAVRREETIVVKTEAGRRLYRFTVLETPRGPLLPRSGLVGRKDRALALRWSVASRQMAARASYRTEPLLRAADSRAAIAAVEALAEASLNIVVGDTEGGVARRATGFVPLRLKGDGLTPTTAAYAQKAWGGFLHGAALPGDLEAKAGWVGTANHDVAGAGFGRAYSDLVSPSWRYQRMKALFDGAGPLDAELSALAQRDVLNGMAAALTPMIVEALENDPERRVETQAAAEILKGWDRRDEAAASAPLIFQEIIRRAAWRLYEPSLGSALAGKMLERREFWQERFAKTIVEARGPIFELARIKGRIGRDVLLRQATVEAMERLERLHGSNPKNWRWGDAMRVRFSGPIPAPEGLEFLSAPLGGRLTEISGSAETLDRANAAFARPDPDSPLEEVTNATSLRVVVDLADDEKILAVQAGGVTGRSFHAHLDDQIEAWAGLREKRYWWFSEAKILENTVSELKLSPSR